MTYNVALCHPDEITKISSLSHPDDLAIPSISSGWLIVDALCHPDDLPGLGISSGWVTANSLCHPDDILFRFMSSGWLNWGWFLIRMSYGNVIMSSGWDTLPFLSHPDEIANFDFPHHAVFSASVGTAVILASNIYGNAGRDCSPSRRRRNGSDGVSNHQPHDCLLNRLFRHRSKKSSKLLVTGLCVGNSPGTVEFPARRASYAENVSIWWPHHAMQTFISLWQKEYLWIKNLMSCSKD